VESQFAALYWSFVSAWDEVTKSSTPVSTVGTGQISGAYVKWLWRAVDRVIVSIANWRIL